MFKLRFLIVVKNTQIMLKILVIDLYAIFAVPPSPPAPQPFTVGYKSQRLSRCSSDSVCYTFLRSSVYNLVWSLRFRLLPFRRGSQAAKARALELCVQLLKQNL